MNFSMVSIENLYLVLENSIEQRRRRNIPINFNASKYLSSYDKTKYLHMYGHMINAPVIDKYYTLRLRHWLLQNFLSNSINLSNSYLLYLCLASLRSCQTNFYCKIVPFIIIANLHRYVAVS